MYQVITLQGGSRNLNLYWAEGFRHQRCPFFKNADYLEIKKGHDFYLKNVTIIISCKMSKIVRQFMCRSRKENQGKSGILFVDFCEWKAR